MPTSLFLKRSISLKSFRLALLFLVFPLTFFGQSLSGLWTGVMTNDSSSVRKDQSFEIALTEYRGKVYGYSRSEFIVNDTLYFIMKRVKGTINGDLCEVVDDEIISCNFLKKIDKGVKVTSTFIRNKKDSTWYLAGKWATNQTKKYYTVTGKVALQEEKDLSASKIFPHLEELNIAGDMPFYKERKTETIVLKTAQPENKRFETLIKTEQLSIINDAAIVSAKPDVNAVEVTTVPVRSTQIIRTNTTPVRSGAASIPVKTEISLATVEVGQGPERLKTGIKTEQLSTIESPVTIPGKPDTKSVNTTTVFVSPTQAIRTDAVPVKTAASTIPVKTAAGITKVELKNEPGKQKTIVKNQQQTTSKEPATETKVPVAIAVQMKTEGPVEMKKPAVDVLQVAASVAGRKSEFSQEVIFRSDSLELALYDNGEIDGDTVSVYLNGEVLLPKQGLKASAIKKTIYITPGNEEFTLVLYADNLGKYPPNTGLLVVHDGDDVYNIRFSADLQKNAGVVFRRKK